MFLVEVQAFLDSTYAVDEVDEDTLFRAFGQIVNKFIKSGSSYEVNIDSRARAAVMRYGEEAVFKNLDSVRRWAQTLRLSHATTALVTFRIGTSLEVRDLSPEL